MADRVQRPKPQGGDYRPHYRKREADAYMDQLESELLDTRRALKLMCSYFNILEIHASQKFPSTVSEYLCAARRERTEEIKGRLAE